jgi:hypothetical protein
MPNQVPDYDPEVFGQDEQAPIETTYDGQTFAWGPGQVRNFLDDGVGKGHQAFAGGGLASIVREDGHFATNGESRA